jgi:hypothetical protein
VLESSSRLSKRKRGNMVSSKPPRRRRNMPASMMAATQLDQRQPRVSAMAPPVISPRLATDQYVIP